MTPEKDAIIRNIFEKRLNDVTSDKQNERKKKINKFIKDAFRNITNIIEQKETEKQVVRRLEYND